MSVSTITIKIPTELKKEFEDICDQIGLTSSVAINVFIKALVRDRKFPFELKAPDQFYLKGNINFI